MNLTYEIANPADIEPIYQSCIKLIWEYEDLGSVDLSKVLPWIRRKLESSISEYTRVLLDGVLVAYYHFAPSEGKMELDDLYVLPAFRDRGIGTAVLRRCVAEGKPIYFYVFTKNTRAIALYEREGFRKTEDVSPTRQIMVR